MVRYNEKIKLHMVVRRKEKKKNLELAAVVWKSFRSRVIEMSIFHRVIFDSLPKERGKKKKSRTDSSIYTHIKFSHTLKLVYRICFRW